VPVQSRKRTTFAYSGADREGGKGGGGKHLVLIKKGSGTPDFDERANSQAVGGRQISCEGQSAKGRQWKITQTSPGGLLRTLQGTIALDSKKKRGRHLEKVHDTPYTKPTNGKGSNSPTRKHKKATLRQPQPPQNNNPKKKEIGTWLCWFKRKKKNLRQSNARRKRVRVKSSTAR